MITTVYWRIAGEVIDRLEQSGRPDGAWANSSTFECLFHDDSSLFSAQSGDLDRTLSANVLPRGSTSKGKIAIRVLQKRSPRLGHAC